MMFFPHIISFGILSFFFLSNFACQTPTSQESAVAENVNSSESLESQENDDLETLIENIVVLCGQNPSEASEQSISLIAEHTLSSEQTSELAIALANVDQFSAAIAVRSARMIPENEDSNEQLYNLLLLEAAQGSLDSSYETYVEIWKQKEPINREGLAILLRIAVDFPSLDRTENVLRAVSFSLSQFRSDCGDILGKELRRMTLVFAENARRGVDYRYLPPLLEYLVSLEDFAAILRVIEPYDHGRAQELFANFARLSENYRTTTGRLNIENAGCRVVIDGEIINDEIQTDLMIGSHEVGCENAAAELIIITPNEQITWSSD